MSDASAAQTTSSTEPFRLDGRHALVTGGASGIGEATVRELVRAGAFVWVADVNLPAAEALAAAVGSAKAIPMDVTDPASIAAAVAQIPLLDLLVNNAGIGHVGSIETTELEDFDRLLNVNVRSVYLVSRAFLPLLFEAKQRHEALGAIVNVASVSGLVGIRQRFAYCMSKGAVVSMTRQLAVEYPKQLRVNAVCPGTVQTPFVDAYLEKFHHDTKEETRAELRARQPVGRLGKPEEVASLIRYLASDQAAFTTGSLMVVDGGWTAA